MSTEKSNKNVASEEDIKVLTNIEKLRRIEFKHCLTDREMKAINNVLAEREADKKKIKKLEETLEKANKQLDLDYVDKNYIPKQKVKNKLNEQYELFHSKNQKEYSQEVVDVLEELLEEGE